MLNIATIKWHCGLNKWHLPDCSNSATSRIWLEKRTHLDAASILDVVLTRATNHCSTSSRNKSTGLENFYSSLSRAPKRVFEVSKQIY